MPDPPQERLHAYIRECIDAGAWPTAEGVMDIVSSRGDLLDRIIKAMDDESLSVVELASWEEPRILSEDELRRMLEEALTDV